MQITKSSYSWKIPMLQRLTKSAIVFGVGMLMSACGTVAVEAVNANHPANAAAMSAPQAKISNALEADAVESTPAPVMDHSMHNM